MMQSSNFTELYNAFRAAVKVTEEDLDSFAVGHSCNHDMTVISLLLWFPHAIAAEPDMGLSGFQLSCLCFGVNTDLAAWFGTHASLQPCIRQSRRTTGLTHVLATLHHTSSCHTVAAHPLIQYDSTR
eukprot:GHUV01035648.1.p1 GENE.GHUV01035648.1~~GHUV01035648.1.p1  ORF type:complete len:127 (+),score=19.26 GHUV01035648.1:740-1120(+)